MTNKRKRKSQRLRDVKITCALAPSDSLKIQSCDDPAMLFVRVVGDVAGIHVSYPAVVLNVRTAKQLRRCLAEFLRANGVKP